MMDDEAAEKLPVDDCMRLHCPDFSLKVLRLTATAISHHSLSRNWYNAALFCLDQAKFMQAPSIRSVQAIAILGICSNNFGESDSGNYLWGCAILIAKTIGLDSPVSKAPVEQLSEEGQHRLWWTLVICEWYGGRLES